MKGKKVLISVIIILVILLITTFIRIGNLAKGKDKYYLNRAEFVVCLDEAQTGYQNLWDSYCQMDNKEDDCSLEKEYATSLNDKLVAERESCIKEFVKK